MKIKLDTKREYCKHHIFLQIPREIAVMIKEVSMSRRESAVRESLLVNLNETNIHLSDRIPNIETLRISQEHGDFNFDNIWNSFDLTQYNALK